MRAMEVLPILKEKVAFLSGKIKCVCVCMCVRACACACVRMSSLTGLPTSGV